MKALKKILCSMLTLALMVTMFAGSGMEVRAEEAKDFEYTERWSVIGAERLDIAEKTVSNAIVGSTTITSEIREYEGYEYVNTEYSPVVFDANETGYVVKAWNTGLEMNSGKPYLFHYYKPVEGSGYFQYWFSASHAPGQSMNSGHPASFTNSTVNAEDILNDILQKFSYSNCNVVGVYEDEARTKPISGTYTGGTSRENATDIYIEFDCEHADVPKVSSFCLTDASYDSATKTIKATFTFEYSKMSGQWIFDFATENCQDGNLNWGWLANGSGVASATSEFKLADENAPLVILSGGFYDVEYRDDIFPISMSPITIDPKDPTANVVAFPSQPSGGSCGGSTEAASADKTASEPAKEEVQTPENNYSVFQEATVKNVEKAIEVAAASAVQAAATGTKAATTPVTIDTGVWISFKGNVYQKLQDSGLPVQITFMYKGQRYRVDIPAGADLMSLVDEKGYCGFLNLMAHFGGTKL